MISGIVPAAIGYRDTNPNLPSNIVSAGGNPTKFITTPNFLV
jgi:hypothetical protein